MADATVAEPTETSAGHAGSLILMSTLRNNGQVDSKLVPPDVADTDSLAGVSIATQSPSPTGNQEHGYREPNDNGDRGQRIERKRRLLWLPQQPQVVALAAVSRPFNWKRRRRQHHQQSDGPQVRRDLSDEEQLVSIDTHNQRLSLATTVGNGAELAAPADLIDDQELNFRRSGGEANAYYLYQLSLRVGPFKRSVCLLGLIALCLLLTTTPLALSNYKRQLGSPTIFPTVEARSWTFELSFVELVVVSLVAHQVYFRFQLEKATPQRNHFGLLQLVLLISSALFAALLVWQRIQLIALQPIIMFISYTLLSVNNGLVFTATLLANLAPLVSKLATSTSASSSSPASTSINATNINHDKRHTVQLEPLIPLFVITCVLFHAVGFYLNKQSLIDKRCQDSYNDIKSFLWARKNMDFEDIRLNRMLDSAIPEHLARKMRADIEKPNYSGIFHRIYLDRYENVSILFADIVNFTKISSNMDAPSLVITLNELFGRFDRAAQINKCLRIKILGDCYYCVCGIPDKTDDHAVRAVEMGLDMIEILSCLASPPPGAGGKGAGSDDVTLNMRVGIHSGQVFCGVFGKTRWQFDVYSNDVKKANEAEQSGQPGRVHITQSTRRALEGRYELEANGDKHLEHPEATFFVKPPEIRRQRLLDVASRKFDCDNSAAFPTSSKLNLIATTTTEPRESDNSGPMPTSAAGERSISKPIAESNRVLAAPASPAIIAASQLGANQAATRRGTITTDEQQQPQTGAARVRFRSAGKRLITMLYLIDPPFSNMAPPTQVKTSRLLLQSIQEHQGKGMQKADVDPIWLTFEDKEISKLYENQMKLSPLELAKRLVIFLVCFVSLTLLIYVSGLPAGAAATGGYNSLEANSSSHNVSKDSADGGGGKKIEFRMSKSANETEISTGPPVQVIGGLALDTLESFILIGEIMFFFLLSWLIYVHQAEFSKRRDFFWCQKAKRDKERVALMRSCNRSIFSNLLPPHVANHFLERKPNLQTQSHMSSAPTAGTGGSITSTGQTTTIQPEAKLYSQSYKRIGVMFATVSGFDKFYNEDVQEGLECLRLLNEIIFDFDSILEDEQFSSVEKIKTIGATYMAAIGLSPDSEIPSGRTSFSVSGQQRMGAPEECNDDTNDEPVARIQPFEQEPCPVAATDQAEDDDETTRAEVARCLQVLVEFVFAMKTKLEEISEHAFNNFQLRAGINLGPVTAGVIGASKPQYDIWGNTVNVASRMESTGDPDRIQITEEVYHVLKDFNQKTGYKFTCREKINVKGKGIMTTYYLDRGS